MSSPECPFSKELVVAPPSDAIGALSPSYYPDLYGPELREAVVRDFGETNEATLDAIELHRHVGPLIGSIYATIGETDPDSFIKQHELAGKTLFDVRVAIHTGMQDLAHSGYEQLYGGPDKEAVRAYHDAMTKRYLANKQRPGKTALDRLGDGVGTAANIPYRLVSSAEDFFAEQNNLSPELLPQMMRSSWKLLHRIAEMDLAGYTFWTGLLFVDREPGRGGVAGYRFGDAKWQKILTFDEETLEFKLDISPRALGRAAITITDDDQERWYRVDAGLGNSVRMAVTGAERLRCPITRISKDYTRQYAAFWADVMEKAGIFVPPADK